MIIDSSAIVAVLKQEPEAPHFKKLLNEAEHLRISAATFFELSIVIDTRKNPAMSMAIDELIKQLGIVIEPVTETQARIARQAYNNFGKGSGHKAGLNYGDCFSYALAKDKREPILFKGDDFRHTDLRPAV